MEPNNQPLDLPRKQRGAMNHSRPSLSRWTLGSQTGPDRSLVWHQNPIHQDPEGPVQVEPDLVYRNLTEADDRLDRDPVVPAPADPDAVNLTELVRVGPAETSTIDQVHRAAILAGIDRRLAVARDRGDNELIAALEAERRLFA